MIDLTKDKVDETLTPLEQENIVMEFLKANFTSNPKKLVKLVRKIEPNIPMFIRRSVIYTLKTINVCLLYLFPLYGCLLGFISFSQLRIE